MTIRNLSYFFAPKSVASLPTVPGLAVIATLPDSGTSRADFPGGDARELCQSIKRILALPNRTRIFVGHDYGRDGRKPQWESTVAAQREANIHVKGNPTEDEFVCIREARDAELSLPHLMLETLQVNIRGSRISEPEANGVPFLKIPLNQFSGASNVCDPQT